MTQIEYEKWIGELFLDCTTSISKKKDDANMRQITKESFILATGKLMDTAFNFGVASVMGGIEGHE